MRLIVIVVGVDADVESPGLPNCLLLYLLGSQEHDNLRFDGQHPTDDVIHLGVTSKSFESARVPAEDLIVIQVLKWLVAATIVLTLVAELIEVFRDERGAVRGLFE